MAVQVHEKKLQRQLVGVDRWRNAKHYGSSHANCWGTWWWQTGTGKTYAALIIVNKTLENNSGNTIVIMVPGPELKSQWQNEILSNVKEEYHPNIRVFTVGEIERMIDDGLRIPCSLFIADELHEYYTTDKLKIFDGTHVMCKWCLGLTADYKDKDNRYKNIEHILPVVDRLDEEEALREGYISKYIEYNLAVELTPQELDKYKTLSDIISKNLSKFGHGGLDVAGKILQGDKKHTSIEYASMYASQHGWRKGMDMSTPANIQILELWSPNRIIGYARLAMENIRERKNLLYYCRNKLKVAVEVVTKFENLKTICFSQKTLFADDLAKVINNHYLSLNKDRRCVVYHSQLSTLITHDSVTGKQKKKGKTILKREAIEAIKNSRNGIISTASSLDKGFDIKDIRLALTTSGTQNPTQYNQRKGRVVRVESYEEDIIVLVINLYIRDTMDEIWLKNRQKKSNSIVYWVDRVDDINYNPRINIVNNDIEI